jgi:hypothetical protein
LEEARDVTFMIIIYTECHCCCVVQGATAAASTTDQRADYQQLSEQQQRYRDVRDVELLQQQHQRQSALLVKYVGCLLVHERHHELNDILMSALIFEACAAVCLKNVAVSKFHWFGTMFSKRGMNNISGIFLCITP